MTPESGPPRIRSMGPSHNGCERMPFSRSTLNEAVCDVLVSCGRVGCARGRRADRLRASLKEANWAYRAEC